MVSIPQRTRNKSRLSLRVSTIVMLLIVASSLLSTFCVLYKIIGVLEIVRGGTVREETTVSGTNTTSRSVFTNSSSEPLSLSRQPHLYKNYELSTEIILKPDDTHDTKPIKVDSKSPGLTTEMNKPTLVLHVGPMKTATTYLQTALLNNRDMIKALREDNVTMGMSRFNYIQMNKLTQNCLSSPINTTHCKDESIWKKYVSQLESEMANAGDQSLILHSTEGYAKVPNNNFTVNRLRSLEQDLNVEVIIFYRRPAGWLPSMYYQHRKGDMFKSRGGRYLDYTSRMPLTFPEYLEKKKDAMVSEQPYDHFKARNTLDLALFFEQVFPGKVQILDFYSPNVGVEFVCKGLSAHKACDVAKILAQKEVKKINTNSFLLFDEDLLVTQAFENKLFHPQTKVRINRHEATLKIQAYLDKQYRQDSLPHICLSPQQQNWLWNTTLLMEDLLLKYNYAAKSEQVQEDNFHLESKKFCHIDATALLRDENMTSYLQSCEFIKENVTASTRDGKTCF